MSGDQPLARRADACVLHLGLPRTGTKTLQWHLFARHSEIHYLGAFIGRAFSEKQGHGTMRNDAMRAIMEELAWGDVRWPNIASCRRHLRQAVEPSLERGRVPVLSWESFSTAVPQRRRRQARNLRKVFGPCRIALTLRRPVDLIESTYALVVRRENRPGKRPGLWYQSIDDWLEDRHDWEIRPPLDYFSTVEVYRKIFGEDSIKLFLFEQLAEDPEGYFGHWCRFLGIDPAEGVRLTRAKAENTTASATVARVARIQRSRLLTRLYGWLSPGRRFDWLRRPSLGRAPVRPRVSRAGRRRIARITREGNRQLAEQFDLPLERYGYPL